MNGDITVESTPGRGSTFRVQICFDTPGVAVSPLPRNAAGNVDLAAIAAPVAGARVLLVEDNPVNRQVAKGFLDKAGIDCTVARHGGEALEQLERSEFDLILMDLQMPEVDGLAATRRIRRNPAWARLRKESPVTFMRPDGYKPFWAITKHADIVEVSKQPEKFRSAGRFILFPEQAEAMEDEPLEASTSETSRSV